MTWYRLTKACQSIRVEASVNVLGVYYQLPVDLLKWSNGGWVVLYASASGNKTIFHSVEYICTLLPTVPWTRRDFTVPNVFLVKDIKRSINPKYESWSCELQKLQCKSYIDIRGLEKSLKSFEWLIELTEHCTICFGLILFAFESTSGTLG